MGERVLFVAALCLLAVSLGHVQARSVEERQDPTIDDTQPDDNVTLITLVDAVLGPSKRWTVVPGDAVTAYVLYSTCYHITFWIIDFSDLCQNGKMQVRYSTSLATMPSTWTNVAENPYFSFMDHPTFTITFGPYTPCTTVYIIARLRYGTKTRNLGMFSLSTSCPCNPCICIGEPHYTNWQHERFDVNGVCSYMLSETCEESNHSLTLIAKHTEVRPNVASIESAKLVVDGHTISLMENGEIRIDDEPCGGTAFACPDLTVAVGVIDGNTEVIFSLTANWWILWIKNPHTNRNELRFEINEDSPLVGKQCGMLGKNYPENENHPFNGYIKKNGAITFNPTEHADSWEVPGSCP